MDICDQAMESERLEREFSISQAQNSAWQVGPVWKGQVACCRECGEPIPVKRLSAIPHASYCIYCQEEIEQKARKY